MSYIRKADLVTGSNHFAVIVYFLVLFYAFEANLILDNKKVCAKVLFYKGRLKNSFFVYSNKLKRKKKLEIFVHS